MPKFSIKVNGDEKVLEIEGGTPLLWVLRDTLNLTGTKFGCGICTERVINKKLAIV